MQVGQLRVAAARGDTAARDLLAEVDRTRRDTAGQQTEEQWADAVVAARLHAEAAAQTAPRHDHGAGQRDDGRRERWRSNAVADGRARYADRRRR
jgi:hypothetical protein